MFFERRQICLELPDELVVARLWWVISRLGPRGLNEVLEFAETRSQGRPPYDQSPFDLPDDDSDDDELPDDAPVDVSIDCI
jgi:hypothetical protein